MRLLRLLFALAVLWPLGALLSGVDPLRPFEAVETVGSGRLVVVGATVAAATACSPLWRALRYFPTLFHEIGHAAVAALLGAKVRKISVHFDASGLATYHAPVQWGRMRRLATSAAGYAFPTLVAMAGVEAAVAGRYGQSVVYLAALCAVAVLLLVRNVWGVATTALAGLLLYLAQDTGNDAVVAGVLGAVIGLLAVGGVRGALIQAQVRDLTDSDAATIGRLLHLPARLVAGAQLLVCVAGLGWSAYRLVTG